MAKKTKTPKTETSKTPTAPKPADGPRPTPELQEQLRKAGSLDAALALLQPPKQRAVRPGAVYAVNPACTEPLPQKRGASNKVYLVLLLRNGEGLTVAQLQSELPAVRSAGYWLRKLAATGHVAEVR